MNRQEIFDTVVTAIFKQGKAARGLNGACKYLNEKGDRCAIGHLMNDEEIARLGSFPGGINSLLDTDGSYLRPFFVKEREFLFSLQRCHDDADECYFLQNFYNRVKRVARAYNLSTETLDKLAKPFNLE